jgi:hypothetical protein
MDDNPVFLSRKSMRSTASDMNWTVATAMSFFWHVLRSIDSGKVEDFTIFVEADFLDFENTDYWVNFRFLEHLRSFTWIGDRCRAKDFKYKSCNRCTRSPDGQCLHNPPALCVIQLARLRDQFFCQASSLKKLEVGIYAYRSIGILG